MRIAPLTLRQHKLIVNNIVRACECIEVLNSTGYKYINLCCGFIAHYNLEGFKDAFRKHGSLREAILSNVHANMWHNFRPTDEHYDYYMSKASVYRDIVEQIA